MIVATMTTAQVEALLGSLATYGLLVCAACLALGAGLLGAGRSKGHLLGSAIGRGLLGAGLLGAVVIGGANVLMHIAFGGGW